MFLSCSLSREMGWSTTVKVHPSFRCWSSSMFCGSLREFCSGPMDLCTGRQMHHWPRAEMKLKRWTEWQTVPSCFSLSSWSAGIRQTGRDRRRSALCFLGMNQREVTSQHWAREICPQWCSALRTCEHQFPFMQQTSVRNEILQSDSLQEMLQTLQEERSKLVKISNSRTQHAGVWGLSFCLVLKNNILKMATWIELDRPSLWLDHCSHNQYSDPEQWIITPPHKTYNPIWADTKCWSNTRV